MSSYSLSDQKLACISVIQTMGSKGARLVADNFDNGLIELLRPPR